MMPGQTHYPAHPRDETGLQMIEAEMVLMPDHHLAVDYRTRGYLRGRRGRDVGEPGGEVGAVARPQPHALLGVHNDEAVAVPFQLIHRATEHGRLGGNGLGRLGQRHGHRPSQRSW